MLCYLFLTPTYQVIFFIFSVCNIDDISWGNRGSSTELTDKQASFRQTKTLTLLAFVFSNVMFAYIMITIKDT